jgi:hypothetical protein
MFNLQQRSEENTNTQRTVVMLTKDYGMFKYLRGNRILSETNIQAIRNQLLQRGQQQPIIVNERNEVIDGQHRLEACKRLKMPVQYIKRAGANLDDVISTNIVGKKWTLMDYVNRFAVEGKADYINLQKFIIEANEYGFAPSTAVKIAQGSNANDAFYMYEDGVIRRGRDQKASKALYHVGDAIKRGSFKIPNEDEAKKRLEQIHEFKEFSFYNKVTFVNAIIQCMRIKEMDFDRLLESARKYQRRFTNEASTENFVIMFEEVYNWRRKNKLPIVNNPQRHARA